MGDKLVCKASAKNGGSRFLLGDMVGTAAIVGDLISPVIDLREVEAYEDLSLSSNLG